MFKVNYIVSAGTLEKLLKATDDISIKHSNIEHLRQADDTKKTKQLHKPPPRRRASGADTISLTDKRPKKDTMRDKVVVALEKLEVTHGVGEVSRDMLREQCKTLGLDPQILYQLTAEGYVVAK